MVIEHVDEWITVDWLQTHTDLFDHIFRECVLPSGTHEIHGEPNFIDCDLSGITFHNSDLGPITRCVLDNSNLSTASIDTIQDCSIKYCIGDRENVFTFQLPRWPVVISGEQIAIGCKQMSYSEWLKYEPIGMGEVDYMSKYHDLIIRIYEEVRNVSTNK